MGAVCKTVIRWFESSQVLLNDIISFLILPHSSVGRTSDSDSEDHRFETCCGSYAHVAKMELKHDPSKTKTAGSSPVMGIF